MMLSLLAPLAVALIGVLVYALATSGKAQRIGEITFAVGLLWTVYILATQHATLRL